MTNPRLLFLGFIAVLLCAISCKPEEESIPLPQSGEDITIFDLPADTGQPQQPPSGKHTFFSFEEGIVDRADSATDKWDIAFQMTTIRLNSGVSGPGNVQGQIVEGLYQDLTTFPESGYQVDTDTSFALGIGDRRSWYTYDSDNRVINPTSGKIITLKLDEGTWVKMEILSYYKGMPTTPTQNDKARYYTFRYQIVSL